MDLECDPWIIFIDEINSLYGQGIEGNDNEDSWQMRTYHLVKVQVWMHLNTKCHIIVMIDENNSDCLSCHYGWKGNTSLNMSLLHFKHPTIPRFYSYTVENRTYLLGHVSIGYVFTSCLMSCL